MLLVQMAHWFNFININLDYLRQKGEFPFKQLLFPFPDKTLSNLLIKIQYQMNNDSFLHSLADFRDLKSQKYDTDSHASQSSFDHPSQDFSLDLNNNQKLIKSFKELREQLKQSNKNCQKLKMKLNEREAEVEAYKLKEKDKGSQIYQLKNQIHHSEQEMEDLKRKMEYLKQTSKGAVKMQDQMEFLKVELVNHKAKLEKLTEENKKGLQLSVMEKIDMEEKINKFTAKQESDLGYIQNLQSELSKQKEKCLKLQNQLRRSQIQYDEEIYNKKWVGGNYEREHLQEQVKQLEKQLEEMSAKTKKEKERRNWLEKKVLELEEMTGLWTVKAETFKIENTNLFKKCKKMDKKMDALRESKEVRSNECLSWQQKFLKLVVISEELISRVKRQLIGDVVNLAKSSEFKINKLKEEDKQFVVRKSPSISRKRSKSRAYSKSIRPTVNEDQTPSKGVLKNIDPNEFSQTKPKLKRENLLASETNRQTEKESQFSSLSHPLVDIENIDAKVRRQREEMQRKIKEKRLYQKIEVACSPEKEKLRCQYLRMCDL